MRNGSGSNNPDLLLQLLSQVGTTSYFTQSIFSRFCSRAAAVSAEAGGFKDLLMIRGSVGAVPWADRWRG